jgi:UDP-galactopyranose mutase
MTSSPRVVIVGGGLTGCTIAYRLALANVPSTILERESVPGGLVRSERMNDVLYEPHGSHIFHTDDEEVWRLANLLTPFNDYRHRVDIVIEGKILNWPLLLSDIDAQSDSDRIKEELESRRYVSPDLRAESANFEDWCLELMGPLLYERYVRPYTQKQWGCSPRDLPAKWAPRRVSVRWDNDPYLFPDRYQGWPSGPNGYTDLIDGLLASNLITLETGADVGVDNIQAWLAAHRASTVVLTCPLDVFCNLSLGSLGWRGILVRSVYLPHVDVAQGAMVVNYPALDYPFIRVHETKHASRQQCEGTVLGFEFTNAPTRYYPIPSDRNEELNRQYKAAVSRRLARERIYFAGRLANFVYIDMDDCMRQALDTATELLSAIV